MEPGPIYLRFQKLTPIFFHGMDQNVEFQDGVELSTGRLDSDMGLAWIALFLSRLSIHFDILNLRLDDCFSLAPSAFFCSACYPLILVLLSMTYRYCSSSCTLIFQPSHCFRLMLTYIRECINKKTL